MTPESKLDLLVKEISKIVYYGNEETELQVRQLIVDFMKQEPEWISIKDRQPEKNGRYLVVSNEQDKGLEVFDWVSVRTVRICHYFKEIDGFCRLDISYWAELPEIPKIKF